MLEVGYGVKFGGSQSKEGDVYIFPDFKLVYKGFTPLTEDQLQERKDRLQKGPITEPMDYGDLEPFFSFVVETVPDKSTDQLKLLTYPYHYVNFEVKGQSFKLYHNWTQGDKKWAIDKLELTKENRAQ